MDKSGKTYRRLETGPLQKELLRDPAGTLQGNGNFVSADRHRHFPQRLCHWSEEIEICIPGMGMLVKVPEGSDLQTHGQLACWGTVGSDVHGK